MIIAAHKATINCIVTALQSLCVIRIIRLWEGGVSIGHYSNSSVSLKSVKLLCPGVLNSILYPFYFPPFIRIDFSEYGQCSKSTIYCGLFLHTPTASGESNINSLHCSLNWDLLRRRIMLNIRHTHGTAILVLSVLLSYSKF